MNGAGVAWYIKTGMIQKITHGITSLSHHLIRVLSSFDKNTGNKFPSTHPVFFCISVPTHRPKNFRLVNCSACWPTD